MLNKGKEQSLRDQVRTILVQLSLELDASSQAAKAAVSCTADDQALWASIQQMYGRLNQANYFAERIRTFVGERGSAVGGAVRGERP